ncbi:hypothetical protein, partial [Dysgonomonas sp. 521]|uniref:hypothetical protein n=1 Tax=Dysgonomonas sp. 521 TaxID=2302932 RepID=UPI001C8825EF
RTEKLSPVVPMVLQVCGRVGYRRFKREVLIGKSMGTFCVYTDRMIGCLSYKKIFLSLSDIITDYTKYIL